MNVRKMLLGLVAGGALASGIAGSASAVDGIGIPAQIVDVTKETVLQSHPTTDYGTSSSTADDRVGTTQWRVVKDTGNCCENHITTSKEGRLFDIGGSFINYTDDRGLTWKSVRPLNPLVNGEGSMAMAPNGDVIGMTWDAYSGDHFVAYKYNAVSGKWFTWENPLHQIVYDRPWLTVVPGPFAIGLGADTVPYIAFVQGGTGVKDPLWVTTDGLSYTEASSFIADGLTDTQVNAPFPIQADPSFDWIQPIRSAPVTGLGGGYALAAGSWLLNPQDRKWDQWRLPDGSAPPTYIQIDSAGRIHNIRSAGAGRLEYRISKDGGLTWTSATFPLPFGGLTDFKVNKAVGISALALRLSNQDWVYKFDITGDTAKLLRRYRVGLGDVGAGSSVGALTNPRMDFQTVAIFPDGRVAVAFLDSTTLSHPPGTGALGRLAPALAIELDTTLPPLNPDLTVAAPTVSKQRVTSSDDVTFAVEVRNLGPADASNVPVRLLVDGAPVGADQTVASLPAGATATVSTPAWSGFDHVGAHTVRAVVDPANAIAERNEANNEASTPFTVEKSTTSVSYTGDRTQDYHDPATLSAVLTNVETGAALAGKQVEFTLAGSPQQGCSASTNASGAASCSVTVAQPAGSYQLTASFAGDPNYALSSAPVTFVVTPEETTLAYTGGTVLANGGSATLSGVLKEDGVTPVAGRTLTLTLGSGSGSQSCTGTTTASGSASCTIATVAQPNGNGTVSASFAGDGFYDAATGSASALVYDFAPGGGAFVIGDLNAGVGTPVTFWGSQWSKRNSLSGGPAPSAFKGFARFPARPSCGTSWSTDTGSGAPPAAPLPAYIGVIATSSASQSGSAQLPVSGDTKRVVVVRTNPGYQADPAYAGTGTVTAVVC